VACRSATSVARSISERTFYRWKKSYDRMLPSEARELKHPRGKHSAETRGGGPRSAQHVLDDGWGWRSSGRLTSRRTGGISRRCRGSATSSTATFVNASRVAQGRGGRVAGAVGRPIDVVATLKLEGAIFAAPPAAPAIRAADDFHGAAAR
jgi:hypothetical protein